MTPAQAASDPVPNRRQVLIGLTAEAGATYSFGSHAAVSAATKRLGILSLGNPDDPDEVAFQRLFLASLANKGWADGKNLSIVRVYSGPERTIPRLTVLAHELVRKQVDVILTGGSFTTLAAARATDSVPIVFSEAMPLIVEQGLIDSYARPGRNVTGPALVDSGIGGKGLQFLKELVPSATRLARIWAWDMPPVERLSGGRIDIAKLAVEGARRAGFELRGFSGRDRSDIADVFQEIDRWGAHAVSAPLSDVAYVRQVAAMTFSRRLPSLFAVREAVDAGGLLSYGSRHEGDYRLGTELAASYVDRIFRGANPATLPVELATRYELVINARTAAALGLSIPAALRVGAEIVG